MLTNLVYNKRKQVVMNEKREGGALVEEKTICCPKFNPVPWDNQFFEWNEKKFITAKVFTFFYMPIGFGKVISKLQKKVELAGASIPDYLCLSSHTSKWSMDIYLAVDKEVPSAENVVLTGKFYSKVYEGPFSDTGKWTSDFESIVKAKNLQIKNWFMWYTTCPKCAKKYGKNYVVIFAEIQ